jgi:hypothetical protein
MRANAARTAWGLVGGFFSGAGVFAAPCWSSASPLADGIIGSIWVGAVRPCSMGCVPIGPVLSEGGCLLGMTDNVQRPLLFAGQLSTGFRDYIDRPSLGR